MINRNLGVVGIILVLGLMGLVSAQQIIGSVSTNIQTSQPSFYADFGIDPSESWDDYGSGTCQGRQDYLVFIPPGGCTPPVVRSDLLEEQNVPVFCKLSAIQMNPLIDVSRIRGISFSGQRPDSVLSTRYYPARAYLQRERGMDGSPLLDNIGYLAIVLKKNPVEAEMPDFVNGTLRAVIDYDVDNAYGIGAHEFYSRPLNDVDWLREYLDYSFWNGKGYVRVEDVQEDSARVSVYQNQYDRIETVSLKKRETSNGIYLGGYYCAAGMKIELTDISYPVDKALLIVDDEEFWVSEGTRFLDDKCRVVDIEMSDSGDSKVSISCSGAGSFELNLGMRKARLNVSGVVRGYEVGEFVKAGMGVNISLGYVGADEDGKFVVLVNSSLKGDEFVESGIIEHIRDNIDNLNFGTTPLNVNINPNRFNLIRLNESEEGEDPIIEYEIQYIASLSGEDLLEGNDLLNSYYQNATQNYEDVFDFYRHESPQNLNLLEPWGAQALKRAADLSGLLGLAGRQEDYLQRLIANYPELGMSRRAEVDLENLRAGQFSTESSAIVYVDNFPSFISLVRVKSPSFEELGAELRISDGGTSRIENLVLNEISENSRVKLKEINEDSVSVEVSAAENADNQRTETRTIEIRESENINGLVIRVNNINFNREARIKLHPFNQGTRTETNFSFGVGIEKRAIELSPERTLKMMESLVGQIAEWKKINDNLGKVIKGLKGACFATSAMLTVKNFFSGLSGESLARNDVMTSEGGWNNKCRALVSQGEHSTIQGCLLANNDLVNADVSLYQSQIEAENEIIQGIQDDVGQTDDDIFSSGYNINDIEERYRQERFIPFWESNQDLPITLRDGTSTTLGAVIEDENDIAQLSMEEMKNIVVGVNTGQSSSEGDSVLGEMTQTGLGARLQSLNQRLTITREVRELDVLGGELGISAIAPPINDPQQVVMSSVSQDSGARSILSEGSSEAFWVYIPAGYEVPNADGGMEDSPIAGKKVLVGLNPVGGAGTYDITEAYVIDSNGVVVSMEGVDVAQTVGAYYSGNSFTRADSTLYNNQIIEEGIVEYHQTAPYVGLPALVPFDMRNGWYVATDYIITGFGRPFDDSGRAVNFWICNVGQNGLIDFKQGDDCRYYNRGTGQSVSFPGLTPAESEDVVRRAESALLEASNQYRQGINSVVINNVPYGVGIAEDATAGQCSDFMSPRECWLMFNVCDPVLCPASRCDFGGQYRVANVVQSGIIGSLLLCLPNIQEGIMVPICLSGVHAGLESYISILESTVKCLNESLETGRNIGICDEVKSIYLCEFFWKQAVPLMDVLIPKMFEIALGQGARGGGEYLTVQASWNNMQKSIAYFNNEYAVSSMQAFNIRSTEGIGSEVCKSFVSGRYPNSAEFFDNLVEPDSPPQFSGWFSENQLTTATVPPLSHYKVYYHIYAGRDSGSHYVVYLSTPTDSSLAHTSQTVVIDRGYIEKGGQVDEAKDKELVSGYTELCIEVNGQVECGFGQASTSFFMNTLADNYAASQAADGGITNSADCVGGVSNTGTLFNSPNLQFNVEEGINPEIYKRGIIRVCSSDSPGAGVDDLESGSVARDSYDRWKDVGYCDDPEIRCWIDTESVRDVLNQNKQLLNETLGDINTQHLAEYLNRYNMDDGVAENYLREGIGWIDGPLDTEVVLDVILNHLNNVAANASIEEYRARALYYMGRIYHILAQRIFGGEAVQARAAVPTTASNGNNGESASTASNGNNGESASTANGETETPVVTYASVTPSDVSTIASTLIEGTDYVFYEDLSWDVYESIDRSVT